jgi:hypothetical protein
MSPIYIVITTTVVAYKRGAPLVAKETSVEARVYQEIREPYSS